MGSRNPHVSCYVGKILPGKAVSRFESIPKMTAGDSWQGSPAAAEGLDAGGAGHSTRLQSRLLGTDTIATADTLRREVANKKAVDINVDA